MDTARFSLVEYRFTKVNIDFSTTQISSKLALELNPQGKFFSNELKYELT